MTALQIVLLSIVGVFSIASIVFMIMFIVESNKKEKEEVVEITSVYSTDTGAQEETKEESDVSSMLSQLDEQAKEETTEVVTEEVIVPEEAPVVEEAKEAQPAVNIVINNFVPETTEEKEEVKEEVVEEKTEETTEETAVEEKAEEVTEETAVEERAEETTAPVVEEAKETAEETVSVDSLPDYKTRLDSVIEKRNKLDKDLVKIEKSILNYERTKRRKTRNQRMLDRRASELTNLNLVMYSVTDIKNVDEEKKQKQEELTSHIAELKASIQDAEEFLNSNKEKNDHNIKMAKFLNQEKTRFNDEIAELKQLIEKLETGDNQ